MSMQPEGPAALRLSFGLKAVVAMFLVGWCVVAMFPLVWIAVMSFRAPVDALSSNPLVVLAGPVTLRTSGGLSVLDFGLAGASGVGLYWLARRYRGAVVESLSLGGSRVIGGLLASAVAGVVGAVVVLWLLPMLSLRANQALAAVPGAGWLAAPVIGMTLDHYRAVWVQHGFTRNFTNSMLVTCGVVTVSLSVGTLAGYGLARSGSRLAFWLLLAALVFRALPHSVLAAGYIPAFLNSRELLAPLWNAPASGWFFRLFADSPPLLYGQPMAIIIVLVSINQPFTIWMLRSFFQNIPTELDEAARVDGCSHFGAFYRAIMPVMWPGVITTGLFSFLLAYNDYLVTALLLDAQSMTMVPAITQFLNRDTRAADQIEAIAAAVSITAPLFLLVVAFQRQLVAGLTQGAVKG